MSIHRISEPKDYLRFLHEYPHELDLLFRDLLIGVTSFFRDPEAFKTLSENILPRMFASKPDGYTIRIWSGGCSTGEEAYSLVIAAWEVIQRVNPTLQLQVFATDIDDRAIGVARRGAYPLTIANDISEARLHEFFSKEENHYQIRKDLREHVIFAPHDITSDPPFTKLDILACRNVLIYLDAELQRKLLPVFHYAVRPGGLLFIGNSESAGNYPEAFVALDKKWRLYESTRGAPTMRSALTHAKLSFQPKYHQTEKMVTLEPSGERTQRPVEIELLHLLERHLLRSYTPPTVIVSDRGEIVYIHGHTGAFLELAPGEPTSNILTMARPGLMPALSALMRRASAENGEAVQHGVRVANDGNSVIVNVVVRAIAEPDSIRGLLMITFEEARSDLAKKVRKTRVPIKSQEHLAELEVELQYTKESLQRTAEDLQTSDEEHKSVNEELQSTNEELQSTNEELETSKEELQSLNEELQTMNAALQKKIEDLGFANDDMTNLLNNTSIATIFLDDALNIKRFTRPACDIIKIIPSDVGRSVADLVSTLEYDLVPDAQDVLRTLMTKETEVRSITDQWFRVRMMPYRTSRNVISGLVVTFVDVTQNKLAELQISKTAAYAQSIVDTTVRQPLLVLDEELRVVSGNESFFRTFGLIQADLVGVRIYEIENGVWNLPEFRERLEQVLPRDSVFTGFRMKQPTASGGIREILMSGRRLEQAITLPGKILLAIEDVTDTSV